MNLPKEEWGKAKRHFKFTFLAKEKQIYYLNNHKRIESKNISSHYQTWSKPDLAWFWKLDFQKSQKEKLVQTR